MGQFRHAIIGKPMKLIKVKERFYSDLNAGKEIIPVAGIWGSEDKGTTGYVESVERPESGGTFTQSYGCNYILKGFPDGNKIAKIELAKSILFGRIATNILTLPFVLLAFVVSC